MSHPRTTSQLQRVNCFRLVPDVRLSCHWYLAGAADELGTQSAATGIRVTEGDRMEVFPYISYIETYFQIKTNTRYHLHSVTFRHLHCGAARQPKSTPSSMCSVANRATPR